MTIQQEQYDDVLSRTALAALFYFPPVTDGDDSLENDISYCLEPVTELATEQAEQLRDVVGRVVTDPTAHRSELLELVLHPAQQPD